MKKNAFVLVLLLLAGLIPPRSMASHISLKIDPASSFSDNKIHVTTRVTNKGDEPAMSVQMEAVLGDNSAWSEKKTVLHVNKTYHTTLDLGEAPQPPGIYTIIIKTHYADANGRPFTALTSIPLVTADLSSRKMPITARLSDATISKYGDANLIVRSTQSNNIINAKVTLIPPNELECPAPVSNISIPPNGKEKIRLNLRNTSALPGSTYSILAVIDYLHNGRHYSLPALGSIRIQRSVNWPAITIIILLLTLFAVLQVSGFRFQVLDLVLATKHSISHSAFRVPHSIFPLAIIAALLAFTLCHIPPSLLTLNTLPTGGDIPAHNYMASHLREQLFGHGRIVSWADGWWCGFPMFQFYFCLPYLLVGLLDFIMPFNIAFKIVSVLGILLLPASAYLAARMMRLPRPGPILLAIAMIPLLFDRSHTMWGVNIYSTFAGMIANSISFTIMLVFIASAFRDSDEGRFRFRTVFLLTALIASHFFTTIIAMPAIAILPFLRPRAGTRKALLVLAKECGLAFLLMAWWLIPLIAKREYSVHFGKPLNVPLDKYLPAFIPWLAPLMFAAIVLAFIRKIRFVAVTGCMLLFSVLLFYFGHDHISKIFVNVRLWPFIIYSLLALAAAGTGLMINKMKTRELAVIAALIAALTLGTGAPNEVLDWAKWNYEGLEAKYGWPVFRDLVLPLKDTPGRLANDLNHKNNLLGSSRIFECVPHVINKPVLEGGIVNSALGSMFSYYIQGETSKNCAGFPTILKPTTFNFTNATKHLELFNVKHFIARWHWTKAALARSKDWRLLRRARDWELYVLTTHDGNYVFVPENRPLAVKTENWKEAGLNWIYTIEALNQPFAILRHGEKSHEHFKTILTYNDYLAMLLPPYSHLSFAATQSGAKKDTSQSPISREEITDNTISFTTRAVGLPHIIKMSYYPNWKVRGAKKIYMVTPCFMLVYPDQEQVELYYGYTLADNIGRLLSALALLTLCAMGIVKFRGRRKRSESNRG